VSLLLLTEWDIKLKYTIGGNHKQYNTSGAKLIWKNLQILVSLLCRSLHTAHLVMLMLLMPGYGGQKKEKIYAKEKKNCHLRYRYLFMVNQFVETTVYFLQRMSNHRSLAWVALASPDELCVDFYIIMTLKFAKCYHCQESPFFTALREHYIGRKQTLPPFLLHNLWSPFRCIYKYMSVMHAEKRKHANGWKHVYHT
jgi:hypothetical protein